MPRKSRPNRFKTTNPVGRSKGRCSGRIVRGPRSRGREWIDRRGCMRCSPLPSAGAGGMGDLDRGGPARDEHGGCLDRTREPGRTPGRRRRFLESRQAGRGRRSRRAFYHPGSDSNPRLGSPGHRFITGSGAWSISDQIDSTPRNRGFRTRTGRRRPAWSRSRTPWQRRRNMPAWHRLALCPRSSASFT